MKDAKWFISEIEKIVKQFNDGLTSDEEAENKLIFCALNRLGEKDKETEEGPYEG